MKDDNIINKRVTLKEDISKIKTIINWLKWSVLISIAIGIFISGVIVNSIKETNAAQYQMFEQKINEVANDNR